MRQDKNIFLPRGEGLRIFHHRGTESTEISNATIQLAVREEA
jgi:hypothetical protein